MKSWQTILAGAAAVLGALSSAFTAQFDSDPATVPNWGLAISLVAAGIGLVRARQTNVTSEQAGAK